MVTQPVNFRHSSIPAATASVSIVFLDSGVEHLDSLVNGVVKDAQVVVLDSSRDGVEQITEILAGRDDVGTVHIVSHGAPGCLYLGNSQLSLGNLEQYASQLKTWFTTPNSLFLYGCNVAAGDAGAEFIQKLHQLTGVDIAASAKRTGSTVQGGDWELEVRTSEFVPSLAFLPQVMATYAGVFTPAATLATAPGDGGVRVALDWFGSFGSSINSFVSNAFYDPVGSLTESGTTFESGVAIRFGDTGGRVFLSSGSISSSGNLTDGSFTSVTPNSLQSTFTYNGLNFVLDQRVSDLFDPNNARTGSQLTQTYTITNPGSTAVNFELIRYLDGDLNFDGTLNDRGGYVFREGKDVLFETDSGGSPFDRTTFVGITAVGGNPLPGLYEIDSFSGLRGRIISGVALDNIITGDTDGDNFVDVAPYDVTLALGRGFVLNPGQSTTYTTFSIFGDGKPAEITVNIAPVAVNDTATTNLNTPVTIDVLANDSDAENDPLSFTIATNPTNGTVAVNDNGTPGNLTDDFVTYTPNSGFIGTDSFTYQLSDGRGGTTTGTVGVTVQAPPQPTVNITATDATAAETGNDTGTYRISRDSSSGSLSVELALSGNAGASDYSLSNNISVTGSTATVVFADGQSFVDVVLNPVNDPIAEFDETLTLTLNSNAAYILGSNTSSTVTIAASDQIIGTPGNDNLGATPGDDILYGLDGNDNIAAEEGNDIVYGGNGNDILDGDEGDDILYGGAGNDRVEGSDGNDRVFGEAGNDILTGDRGSDFLWGGAGNDRLEGGTGSDTFVLAAGEGTDIISDFRLGQSDKIGLAGGLTFNDLSFSDNQILFGSEVLATLSEFNTTNLTAANFISV